MKSNNNNQNNTDNNNDRSSKNPDYNPSKAMDSKREVAQSNDEKTDQDFPGYPHYPAKEDVMDKRTDTHRVDMDVENLPNNRNTTGMAERFMAGNDEDKANNAMSPQPGSGDDDLGIRPGTEADLTNDDVTILNTIDDAELGLPVGGEHDDLNTDLDIPGSELDDQNEIIGEEDEENNYYSLGGDRHDDQESDPSENW